MINNEHQSLNVESVTGKIIRSIGVIMGLTLLCKVMGFFEKLILAYLYGTSMEVDAYLVAYSIPFMLFIMVKGLIGPVFLPTFTDTMIKKGEQQAWGVAGSIGILVGGFLVGVSIAGFGAAPALISVFAPGFDTQKVALAAQLTRVMFPAAVFLGLSTLTMCILNSYKRFAIPGMGDAVYKLLIIGGMVVLYRSVGIYGLAVGMVVGALGKVAVQIGGLWKKGRLLKQKIDVRSPPIRRMGRLMVPLVLGVVFSQISLLIDNMFASTLPTGSISALSYARKIIDLPVLMVPYALGIVIFTYFSELASRKEYTQLARMFTTAVKMLLLIFIPMTVGVCILREPIIRLLFERGQFTLYSTQLTAGALFSYTLGISAFAVEIILMQLYFALSDTRTPVVVGVGCVLLNITLTVLLIRPFAHVGIALALSVQKMVKVGILFGLLKKKCVAVPFGALGGFLVRVLLGSGVMGGIVWLISRGVSTIQGFSLLGNTALTLGISGVIGLLSFLAFAHLLGIREVDQGVSFVMATMRSRRFLL